MFHFHHHQVPLLLLSELVKMSCFPECHAKVDCPDLVSCLESIEQEIVVNHQDMVLFI